jgi:peptidoglycan/LPS O-acetylase OafA/YrhL
MSEGKRLDHIHGLRGAAAMMVVIQHSLEMTHLQGSALFDPMLDRVNFGRLGVTLFFLISGFVVPFSFRGGQPLRTFAISRFFRLYPAYWVSIALFLVLGFWHGNPVPVDTILANLTMLQNFLGYRGIGNAYWTLALEMMFYGACMLLCLAGMLRSVAVIGTFAGMCLLGSLFPFPQQDAASVFVIPYYVSLFFIGMMLKLSFIDGVAGAKNWSIVLVCAGTATGMAQGGAFFPIPENNSLFLEQAPLVAAMTLPIPLFVLTLWLKPKPGKIMMYLGTISYSAYLFQQPVLDEMALLVGPGQTPIVYILAVLATTVALAGLIYRWVELPLINLGKRMNERLNEPSEIVMSSVAKD